jgi:hypothetical protein
MIKGRFSISCTNIIVCLLCYNLFVIISILHDIGFTSNKVAAQRICAFDKKKKKQMTTYGHGFEICTFFNNTR